MITISAPGKIHLLGEHTVVYGKPAILATVGLRVTAEISKGKNDHPLKKIIEPIVKKELQIQKIPSYALTVTSDIPIGAGLGSSAAASAAYIGALLVFLKVKWDLNLINKLTFEAEKVFHGNPSGGDNSTVVYGGLVWFRKEHPDLKIIQPVPFSIPKKLAKNFVLINTGTPKETTKEMIAQTTTLFEKKPKLKETFLQQQEQLVREFLPALKDSSEKELIRIIRQGQKNLESIGVVSSFAKALIRQIEKAGGAAKICGAGGKTKATGILLAYHSNKLLRSELRSIPSGKFDHCFASSPQQAAGYSQSLNKKVVEKIAKEAALPCFSTALGVEGLRTEI